MEGDFHFVDIFKEINPFSSPTLFTPTLLFLYKLSIEGNFKRNFDVLRCMKIKLDLDSYYP